MDSVPILINGSYERGSIGKVEMTPKLAEIYNTFGSQHLVMNPILKARSDGPPEIIAFGIYPMPAEPAQPPKKKRGRPKKGPTPNE